MLTFSLYQALLSQKPLRLIFEKEICGTEYKDTVPFHPAHRFYI